MSEPDETFRHLMAIDNIGERTVETIIQERPFFIPDLQFVFSTFKFTRTPPYNPNAVPKIKVCFSGTRDRQLVEMLNQTGRYDASIDAGITKSTNLLIVPNVGYNQGSKIGKAFKWLGEAYGKMNNIPPLKVDWSNLHLCQGLNPMILTVDQAYAMLGMMQHSNPTNPQTPK